MRSFTTSSDSFAAGGIDLIAFEKGQRKDNVRQAYLRKFKKNEGVLYVGKAQEKARVMRTERRRCSRTGATCPWIVESTPWSTLFLKFCSYFPYNAKLCILGLAPHSLQRGIRDRDKTRSDDVVERTIDQGNWYAPGLLHRVLWGP
jgi:hypothetical protein